MIEVVTPEVGDRIRIDTTIFQNTASEPMLVIFEDGDWCVETNAVAEDIFENSPRPVHQVIPMNVILNEYAEFDRACFG